ncbi:MAG: hypothetical protein JOZ41_02555, partial [Chloroflexi bacterium]|nr:hypothetical protein [Chloroflexota bacterium]
MATKKTTLRARKASPRARPRSARSSNKQRWKSLLVRLLSFARPHTLPETCALLLGLLALLIIASSAAATLIRAGTPSAGSMWAAALILGALIARFWPRLRRHVDGMTRDRARAYVGCFLLMYVVLGLSWHLSATSLGVGRGYLLPGPFDLLPGAALLLALMAALGVSSLLNLPLGRWGAALWRRGATRLDEARARRTLDRAEVSLPRLIEIEPPPEVEAAATASAQEEH